VGVADGGVGADVMIKRVRGLLGDGDEILRVFLGHGVVERVSGGDGADQDEHDQFHSLLAVIRSVEEADPGAGKINRQRM
jgi:hypothetical protein